MVYTFLLSVVSLDAEAGKIYEQTNLLAACTIFSISRG